MKQVQILMAILLLAVTGLSAQTLTQANPSKPESDQEIKDFITRFYKNLEEAHRTGIAEPVIQMMDPAYMSTRQIVDVDGRFSRAVISLNDYRNDLNAQLSLKDLKVTFLIESINFVKVYDNVGVVSFSLKISATNNGSDMLSFKSHLTDYLKKDESGNWKIVESSGMNIYKKQEVGLCPCTISQSTKNADEYAVKLLAPSGISFKEDNLTFTFKRAEGETLVVVGENAYVVKTNDIICVKENGQKSSLKIGVGSAPIEVINIILTSSMYKDKCLGFRQMDK